MATSSFNKKTLGLDTVEPAVTPPPTTAATETSFVKKPKLGSNKSKKREIPEGLWTKCPKCSNMVFDKELDEKLTRLIEAATEKALPLVIISTSGGARMYEGMLSLMQMAKTCAALAYHAKAKLPYISILTHPTTAGVMASYASVGDLIIAEPAAMIGFAGPRVIKETTQAELPPGFQTAEFLLDRGLIDAIVSRKEMKQQLIDYLSFMTANRKSSPAPG